MNATDVVEEYLLGWVLLSVAVGVLVPAVAVVTRASTLVLAVMVGSVSLTVSVDRFRAVSRRGLAVTLAAHLTMPFLALGIARLLGLAPALTVGFVVVGAVTPELVTPTMTALGDGDVALASTVLVLTGLASLAVVPAAIALLPGGYASVDPRPVVEQLLVAVVGPMGLAVTLRSRHPKTVSRYDDVYPTVSAVMVVLVVGGVTAANAGHLRESLDVLALVAVGALVLNGCGYLLGWVVTAGETRETRIAGTLSVGMRDFAVAAALVVAAGFAPAASLPAVAFGVVEMATSAGLARWL